MSYGFQIYPLKIAIWSENWLWNILYFSQNLRFCVLLKSTKWEFSLSDLEFFSIKNAMISISHNFACLATQNMWETWDTGKYNSNIQDFLKNLERTYFFFPLCVICLYIYNYYTCFKILSSFSKSLYTDWLNRGYFWNTYLPHPHDMN